MNQIFGKNEDDTCLLNDSFDENENSISEVEKWEIVRVLF